MRCVLTAFVIATMVGSAHAGGAGIGIPPMEVDVGATAPIGGGAAIVGPSTDVLVGLHWASLYWKPTTFDIGIGYVGSFREMLPGFAPDTERSREEPKATAEQRIDPSGVARTTMPAAGDTRHRFSLDGGYLELGRTLVNQKHFRAWVSARGELLDANLNGWAFSALGAAMRVASEVYVSGAAITGGHDSGAMVVGTFAIGVYVEASHREIPGALGPNGFTAGLTLRLPFILAGFH